MLTNSFGSQIYDKPQGTPYTGPNKGVRMSQVPFDSSMFGKISRVSNQQNPAESMQGWLRGHQELNRNAQKIPQQPSMPVGPARNSFGSQRSSSNFGHSPFKPGRFNPQGQFGNQIATGFAQANPFGPSFEDLLKLIMNSNNGQDGQLLGQGVRMAGSRFGRY